MPASITILWMYNNGFCRWPTKWERQCFLRQENLEHQLVLCVWRFCFHIYLFKANVQPYIPNDLYEWHSFKTGIFRDSVCIYPKLRSCAQSFHQQLYCSIIWPSVNHQCELSSNLHFQKSFRDKLEHMHLLRILSCRNDEENQAFSALLKLSRFPQVKITQVLNSF